jgi:hypothetical protein
MCYTRLHCPDYSHLDYCGYVMLCVIPTPSRDEQLGHSSASASATIPTCGRSITSFHGLIRGQCTVSYHGLIEPTGSQVAMVGGLLVRLGGRIPAPPLGAY